MLKSTREG